MERSEHLYLVAYIKGLVEALRIHAIKITQKRYPLWNSYNFHGLLSTSASASSRRVCPRARIYIREITRNERRQYDIIFATTFYRMQTRDVAQYQQNTQWNYLVSVTMWAAFAVASTRVYQWGSRLVGRTDCSICRKIA